MALDEHDPPSVGPYLLLGRLGDGGMGTVYLARPHDDERLVALKMIRADLAREPEFRARFLREAHSAQRVARFCTAEVLDVSVDGGRPYLVTEYIDGPTLTAAVRRNGPLSPAELERLAVSVASALIAIHAAGVVHRDLKPGNILLSSSGARVIDFGIARALDATTMLTRAGIGTPAFMAPEQALGQPASPAADVYAWGGVMVFAGTGRLPYGEAPTPVILFRAVNEQPDLSGLAPGLRPLVEQAMAKNPAERPSAHDLLLRLTAGQKATGEGAPGTPTDTGHTNVVTTPTQIPASGLDSAVSSRPDQLAHRTSTAGRKTRRWVGSGFGLAAAAAAVGYSVDRFSGSKAPRPPTSPASPTHGNQAEATHGDGTRLASESQITTDGGIIIPAERIVLTRNAAGAVQGFSAVCTHQGCIVTSVSSGQITCPCHGSRFDSRTGAVIHGPATAALPKVPVVVRDGTIFTS